MFSSHETVKTYKALVYQCSQNVTKFRKYSCSYTVVKSTYNCRNTFAEKQKPKKEDTQRMKLLNLFKISLQHQLMVPFLFLKPFGKVT